jgi:hypothetical protein
LEQQQQQQQKAGPKPPQAAAQSWLPAIGMFAMIALLVGFSVSLYKRRSRTTSARGVFSLGEEMVELGDVSSSEELLLE